MEVTIRGNSMEPTLYDGDNVIFEEFQDQRLRVGDVVLCQHPFSSKNIVKRIKRISKSNKLYVRGDNPLYSSDSRSFGPLSSSKIIGLYKEKYHE
tara:strand:- start:345 stop:629 length:285 start_codon:yes stop_codon:yes gene_type:complete